MWLCVFKSARQKRQKREGEILDQMFNVFISKYNIINQVINYNPKLDIFY